MGRKKIHHRIPDEVTYTDRLRKALEQNPNEVAYQLALKVYSRGKNKVENLEFFDDKDTDKETNEEGIPAEIEMRMVRDDG
jgi:hemerythrin-like domain-containing protein